MNFVHNLTLELPLCSPCLTQNNTCMNCALYKIIFCTAQKLVLSAIISNISSEQLTSYKPHRQFYFASVTVFAKAVNKIVFQVHKKLDVNNAITDWSKNKQFTSDILKQFHSASATFCALSSQ